MPDKKTTILLVDDEALNRRALRRRLPPCEVYEAESYDEAGDVLRRKTVDIVISDNNMPGKPGLEVLRLCARLQPSACRIMFSSHPPPQLHKLVEKEVISHFFAKPGDDSLLELIASIVGAPSRETGEAAVSDVAPNRRQSPRVAVEQPVEVCCATWSQFVKLYTRDISRGGLFIANGAPPPIGTVLEVKIVLPGCEALTLSADVVHVASAERADASGELAGMGVAFHVLDPRQERRVHALIQAAQLEAGPPTSANPAPSAGAAARPHAAPGPGTTPSSETPTREIVAARETPTREIASVHEIPTREIASARVAAPARDATPTRETAPEPAPGSAPRSAEVEAILEQLQAELIRCKEQSDLEALGLGVEAGPRAARTAFYKLSKRYHPDTFGRYGDPEVKRVATEIFILIKGAYARVKRREAGRR